MFVSTTRRALSIYIFRFELSLFSRCSRFLQRPLEHERRSIKLMLLYNGYARIISLDLLLDTTFPLFKSSLDIRRHLSMIGLNDSLLHPQIRRHLYHISTMRSNLLSYIRKSVVNSRLDNRK